MPVIDQCVNDQFAIYHADCMEVLPTLPAETVGLSVYSPPFPELYQYSDDPRDMTNCTSYAESIEQYSFVVRQIHRLTRPGRLSCVHCTDLRHGAHYQRDFPGDIIRVHEEAGMRFFCRITIWKDPWEFARRTRMRSLMHKTITVDDAANSRIAPPDYLLVFKKPGENPDPILHADGFRHYVGGETVPPELVRDYATFAGDPRENLLSHWIWRHYASPVWMDIRRGRLLPFRQARESVEEKHVCPLQLDVIDRCLILWSNPGDVVLTPFMGVGSEVYEAVKMARRGIGVELKATYYRQALRSVQYAAEHAGEEDATETEAGEEEIEAAPEEEAA